MAKTADCYFSLTYGLQGCYMPDSHFGPYHCRTRGGIAYAIRETLATLDVAPSRIRQVALRRLWAQAKRTGTSSIHFAIATDAHNMLEFHGMTEAEYLEAENGND